MEISILQCILIGLWTSVCLCGMLFGVYTNRCIVLSVGVGLILGDLPTALLMGAMGELAFMGFGVGPGGTVPPNPMGPGIVGTIIAITMHQNGQDIGSALSLSIPFAIAFQFIITATYTVTTPLSVLAKKALEAEKYGKFMILANMTTVVFAILGFVIGFTGAFSSSWLEWLIGLIPVWLITGLSVAGRLLPAVGFAMILSVMAKKEYIPFMLLGYVCVAYLHLPVIGIAIVGTLFALMLLFHVKDKGNGSGGNDKEVEFEDGI